jgi:hypothetical protein
MPDSRDELRLGSRGWRAATRRYQAEAVAARFDVERSRARALDRQRYLEPSCVGINPHRRQLRHPVREERSPQIDGLASGANQRELS